MATILSMLTKVRSVNLRDQVPVIIEQTKEEAVKLNRLQLYDMSQDKNEMSLLIYRSPSYATYKNKRNPKPGLGHPDLFLTGSFQNKMFATVEKETLNISSRDSKTFDLIKQYGDDIFGLSEKSKSIYANGVVYEGIRRYITNKTGLKFT